MNTDCAIRIGSSHSVCQDYARVGSVASGITFAMVADGCSSSEDTDIGARILLSVVERTIKEYCGKWTKCYSTRYSMPNFSEKSTYYPCIRSASRVVDNLNLNHSCLDSTFFIVTTHKNTFKVVEFGDGVFVVKYKDGKIQATEIEYPSGYPGYLSYYLDDDRRDEYLRIEKRAITKHYDVNTDKDPIIMARNNPLDPIVFTGNISDCESISIMSDGAKSFCSKEITDTSKTVNQIDTREVIKELIAFKTTRGRFVERRLNKFLTEKAKEGWYHYDDLAVATIFFGK